MEFVKITPHTRIELRFSTAPRHVGYPEPHQRNDLAEQEPTFIGTPLQVEAEIEERTKNLGGTFYAILLRDKKTGHTIGRDALRDYLTDRAYQQWVKGGSR